LVEGEAVNDAASNMTDEATDRDGGQGAEVKSCFVICPIGDEGSEWREHSDDVFFGIIEKVCREFGIEAWRAIDKAVPGDINKRIIGAVVNADLVIADLTGRNANVFYELAVRHWTGKPFIQMSKEDSIPFDIAQQHFIRIRNTTARGCEQTCQQLRQHIQSVVERTARYDTPIAELHREIQLSTSGNPRDAEIVEMKENIRIILHRLVNIEDKNKRDIPQPSIFHDTYKNLSEVDDPDHSYLESLIKRASILIEANPNRALAFLSQARLKNEIWRKEKSISQNEFLMRVQLIESLSAEATTEIKKHQSIS